MKHLRLAALGIVLSAATFSSMALEGGANFGEKFTHIHVGLGSDSPGLALTGEWIKSYHDGDVANAGLNYGLGSDTWILSPGAKVMFTHPKDNRDGYAAALGGDALFALTPAFRLYGQYYWAPKALAAHADGFQQAGAGVSVRPLALLDLRVGYQYIAIDGKDGHKDNVLADGPYVGASLHF